MESTDPKGSTGAGPTVPRVLTDSAEVALRRALDRAGERSREGALDLLAADGLLTYACEAGLEEEDPGGRFRSVALRIAALGEET